MAIITGTAGNDTITNSVSSFGPLTTGGNDSVLGEGGNDSIQGGSGLDTLRGGEGFDSLLGGNDNDFLFGDAGDDVLFGQGGDDRIDGGGGFDVVSFAASTLDGAVNVTVNNIAGVNTGISAPAPLVVNQGADTLTNFEQVNGSTANDTITIVSVNTTLGFNVRGNAGNDLLTGTTDANLSLILDYRTSAVTAGVSVDLAAGRATDGFGGIDTIANFVAVRGTDLADSLFGAATNDRFRGRAGSDFIDGRGGTEDKADYGQSTAPVSVNLSLGRALDGEGGTDTLVGIEEIWGSTGADTLIGDAQQNFFNGQSGADTIDGGAHGGDRVYYHFSSGNAPAGTQGVVVDLAAGVATDAWGFTDRLIGIERIHGTALADSMLGGAESNRFQGRAGNDTLDGGLGGDFAEYNNANEGATVNLTTGTATDGDGGTDLLISIENVIGSAFADRLTGVAQGGRTTSLLRGGAGNDTLVGINGEFVVADYADQTAALSINLGTGTANDGRGGTDTLINIRGVTMFGDFGDTLVGTAFGEWFGPSGGADSVNGLGGFDIIGYGGVDVGGVSVNLTTARARDTGGDIDTILGFEGIATSFGDDTLTGTALGNLIGPSAGTDLVNALGGQDTLSYSLGFSPGGTQFTINEAGDRLPVQGVTIDLFTGRTTDFGGSIDTILGFEHAIGSTASDIIRGATLGNMLLGAEGNDTLEGRAGDDTLDGGAGTDRLAGGADDDTYILDSITPDIVFEGANQGIDTILTTRATLTLMAHVENIVATDTAAHAFTGNGLANALTGNLGADTLAGLAGNDTLDGGAGIDRLVGGIGDDEYIVTTGDVVVELPNQGIDTVFVTQGTAYTLGAGLETLVMAGATLLNGTGNTLANTIIGNDNANFILGLGGRDVLLGGAGADTLVGGLNGDSMTGGEGADRFRFLAATDSPVTDTDVILDFTFSALLGFDRIDLSFIDANSVAAGAQAFSWIGNAAFAGTGAASAGQLRYETFSPDYYGIRGDMNGDGAEEFSINVASGSAPVQGWFFL